MEIFVKEILRIIKGKVEGNMFMLMEIFMKEIGKMVKRKEMVC
jgi:hypothetical protein